MSSTKAELCSELAKATHAETLKMLNRCMERLIMIGGIR